jgi:hypothetical protein
LRVELDPGLHFTEGAESRFRLVAAKSSAAAGGSVPEGANTQTVLAAGVLEESRVASVPYRAPAGCARLELEARTYYCDAADNACRADNVVFVIPLVSQGGAPKGAVLVQRIRAPSSE